MTLHFLGWDSIPLDLAADWMAAELGADQSDVVVALPGARAGRLLRERLAVRLGPSWVPPRLVTAGTLTDVLLELNAVPAGRLARTLAWTKALQGLPEGDLERVVAAPPDSDDLLGWTRVAGEVRTVFAELAAEGLGFADVAEGPARGAGGGGERLRWAALARAQTRMQQHLENEGLVDPHLARLTALEEGRVVSGKRVLLVGVVELNRMTRDLLALTDAECLVFAPRSEAALFDEWGCVRTEIWCERPTSLPLDAWHVVAQPVQQAQKAIECLATFGAGRYRAEEVTVGVARASVTPYLRRRFAARGVHARDAAGTPASETAPARLLTGLAEHLARPTFQTLAALLRQGDLERALRSQDPTLKGRVLPRSADAYHEEHVPHLLDGSWPAHPDVQRDVEQRDLLRSAQAALHALLGPLTSDERRPLGEWAPALRSFLDRTYGTRKLDPEADEQQRRLVEGLAAVGQALLELEEQLPPGLSPLASAAEATRVVLEVLRGRAVAPPPARPGVPTVELLGWVELPLDDAPALVVTGFDEGCVPEALGGDGWLPDAARRELGLPGSADRLARDNYFVELLVHSRRDVAFVSGRTTLEGDPVLPSRIAFLRPQEEVPGRVDRALPRSDRARSGAQAELGSAARPFVPGLGEEPAHWSASAFGAYLSSPYLFWVERIAKLRTIDDAQRELDPLRFGSLAHAVLEDFGKGPLAASEDPADIRAFLRKRLRVQAQARFGAGTYPAVRVQLHQLEYRLDLFAEIQARRAAEGWRIAHVEWSPETCTLDVPGGEPVPLLGSIDRIDRHPDGRWAILDYKTGEGGNSPDKDHRQRGEWTKVQLPLYTWMARDLIGGAPAELGYVTLGGKRASIGFELANWTPDEIAEALDVARRVVLDVRALLASGAPFPHPGGRLWAPIFKALVGDRLVGVGDER